MPEDQKNPLLDVIERYGPASAGGPSSGLLEFSGSTLWPNRTPQDAAVGAHRFVRVVFLPVAELQTPLAGEDARLMDELAESTRQTAFGLPT